MWEFMRQRDIWPNKQRAQPIVPQRGISYDRFGRKLPWKRDAVDCVIGISVCVIAIDAVK